MVLELKPLVPPWLEDLQALLREMTVGSNSMLDLSVTLAFSLGF